MTGSKQQADLLIKLYSEKKLKDITSEIIRAYRMNNHKVIHHYAKNLEISSEEYNRHPARTFRKIMLYFHPDRRKTIHIIINKLAAQGKSVQLEKMSKAIQYPIKGERDSRDVIDFEYQEEYGYDPFQDDLSNEDYIYTNRDLTRVFINDTYDFIEAVRAMMYGNLPFNFLPKDLYHLDGELNLREEGIADLSGIEYCINITDLILGSNRISNVFDLSELTQLESLDLSRNEISDIDPLRTLSSLVFLDLSFNNIEDISPLRNLTSLKFINLIGNPVGDTSTVDFLKKNGTIVI